MRAELTAALVQNPPPVPAGRRKYRIHCTKTPGFSLEVGLTHITYYCTATNPRGKRSAIRIAPGGSVTCAQARRRCMEIRARAFLGGDPAGDRSRARAIPTLADAVRDRIGPHYKATLRAAGEYCDILRLHVLPALGRLHLDEITAAHVASLVPPMLARGLSPSRINRVFAVLRRSMNLAERWGLYSGPNPARSPGMLREEPREHFLDRVQLAALFHALAAEQDRAAAGAIALLALTGARRAEVLNATWANVDLGRGLLTVPLSKSGRRRHVVLSDAAAAVLRQQPRLPGQAHVFPSPRLPGRPLEGVRSAWARAKAAAALPPETRLHDLRHSFASLCIDNGVPLYDVSKLLGHSSQAVTARYSHLRDDRLREAADAVGAVASAGGPAEAA